MAFRNTLPGRRVQCYDFQDSGDRLERGGMGWMGKDRSGRLRIAFERPGWDDQLRATQKCFGPGSEVLALLPARLNDAGQDRVVFGSLHRTIARREFASNHRRSQGPLSRIVGGLDCIVVKKDEEPISMLVQSLGEAGVIRVCQSAFQKPIQRSFQPSPCDGISVR